MDYFIWGKRGSGKTLLASIFCWLDFLEGRGIWGNLPFHENLQARLIEVMDLIELLINDELANSIADKPKTLVLDEMKGQANARLSPTFINRNLGHFVSQARKLGFKLIYTDQILGGYDKWIREMTDRIIYCKPTISQKDIGLGTVDYPEPIKFTYIEFDVFDWQVVNQFSISRKTARHFYGLYDTKQRIIPAELKYLEVGESK